MINEILEQSKTYQRLVGIKLYGENGFWCGIIEDFNEEIIQLKHYTKYGELDGVTIEKIVNIERIDIEDNYLKAMNIVIQNKEKIRNKEIESRIFEELDNDNWQYISLKPYELDKTILVSIQVNNDNYYQGFVNKINQEFLNFEIIGNDGLSEGKCLFKIEDINSVKINDLECRRKLLIHNSKDLF